MFKGLLDEGNLNQVELVEVLKDELPGVIDWREGPFILVFPPSGIRTQSSLRSPIECPAAHELGILRNGVLFESEDVVFFLLGLIVGRFGYFLLLFD